MSADLNKLFFEFKEHMKVKNYSPATVQSYSRNLQQFIEYLGETDKADIKRVTGETLKCYQLKLTKERHNGKGYTGDTISVKIRAVKRFFEYLEEANHILINPAEYIKEPKKETRLPRVVLTKEEARKILDQPNLSIMTGIRDRTMLEVLYSTGIRLEEMINLTIYDSDLQGGLLRVNQGKFAKDRVVPLGRHAVKFIKEYITHIRPHYMKKRSRNPGVRSQKKYEQTRKLFVNQLGRPMTNQVIEIMVRNYTKKAKIKKKVTPHVFRHTFATELVRNGADIRAVQKMLGHSRLSVTQIYTRVAGKEVKETHKKHHPREKDKSIKEKIKPDIKGIKGKQRRD